MKEVKVARYYDSVFKDYFDIVWVDGLFLEERHDRGFKISILGIFHNESEILNKLEEDYEFEKGYFKMLGPRK